MPRFLIVAASLAALVIAMLSPALAAEADRRITIQGSGTASAPPDILTVMIGVEASGRDAAETMRQANAQVGAVFAAARALEVESRDMQTGGVSLSPVYARRKTQSDGTPEAPRIIGYRATNTVMIRLRDLDRAGQAVGALVEAGANRLNGLSFGFADATALMDEARRTAVADARRKAELYAAAAGVELGPVLSIQEQGGGGVRPMAMARSLDMAESAVPLERGENTLTAQVQIVWALED